MKKTRALVAVFMALAMIVMAGCSGSKTPSTGGETKTGGDTSKKKLKVAYVISGSLGDRSFYDSGSAGFEKAKAEFGAEVKVIQSTVTAEWEPNLKAAAEGGYDLIIAGASQMKQALTNVAPKYPNQKFVYLDDVVEGPNIASATFKQNEGSFLAGVVGAMMSKTKTIGFVGGSDIAVLHDFLEGYKHGAETAVPGTKVLVSWAGSFNDPAKGKELTLAQYSQNADVVFNVAGGTGTGIIAAAKEANKFAIGVDRDQDNDAPGNVLTSMLKRVDNAVYDQIKSYVDGKWKAGRVEYGLANGGVGLTEMKVMGDKIPKEVRDKVTEMTAKAKSGEIKVKSYLTK